jgi:hypothetical protein
MVAKAGGGGQCVVVRGGELCVMSHETHSHTATYRAKTTGVSGSMCTAARTLTS